MPISKEKKQKIIEKLIENISKQKIMLFVNFTGLKVKDFFALRKKLKTENNQIMVAKKTLIERAVKKTKINIDKEKLSGQIAIVFGFKDEVLPAKTIFDFYQENPNLKILGGFLNNEYIEKEKVIELAKLPSREMMFTMLTITLASPLANFINVCQANIKGLISVLANAKK